MKKMVLFFILLTFMGELVFDCSTTFVRIESIIVNKLVIKKANAPGSSSDEGAPGDEQKVALVSAPAHSALPVTTHAVPFWMSFKNLKLFSKVLVPCLDTFEKRIERPPIV